MHAARNSSYQLTPDRHIWACASTLMQKHGNDAWFYASKRADELLAAGDVDGHAMFKAILPQISYLEMTLATGFVK